MIEIPMLIENYVIIYIIFGIAYTYNCKANPYSSLLPQEITPNTIIIII